MIASVIQTEPAFGRISHNLEQAAELLRSVKSDLFVLPELFASGYLFEDRAELVSLAESLDGPTASMLKQLSQSEGCAIAAGFPERSGESVYNSMMLVAGGELKAVYRKAHLFAEETTLFDRADGDFQVVQAAGARLGLMVCFDWVFPEAARTLALKGAQVLVHSSNLVLPFCQKAMVTRSIENGVFTLLANRVGSDQRAGGSLTFTGGSEIVSPKGELLSTAPLDRPACITAEINPKLADSKWITKQNHLFKDRRPELYHLGKAERSE